MRARDDVYHVHCFTCASCSVRLAKGDHFGVRDGLIYCRPHYESLRHRDYFGPVELEPLSPGGYWNNEYNGLTVKGRPRKRKIEYMPEEATDLSMMKIPSVVTGMYLGFQELGFSHLTTMIRYWFHCANLRRDITVVGL